MAKKSAESEDVGKIYVKLVDTTGQFMIRSLQVTVKRNIPVEVEQNSEVDTLIQGKILVEVKKAVAEKFLEERGIKLDNAQTVKVEPTDEDLKDFIKEGVLLEVITENDKGLKVGTKTLGADLDAAVKKLKKDKVLRMDLFEAVARARDEKDEE